jgi:Restriction endonuclease
MSSWTEITDRWDDPSTYGRDRSYYEKGKYPPDWDRRRKAIWNQQSDQCGRCGRARENAEAPDVHHLLPLTEGGLNALENLVGLCGDCHNLTHPLNDDLGGDLLDAPPFPATDAVPKVATVRTRATYDEFPAALTDDLESIEEESSPTRNRLALSTHTYEISADHARRLPDETTEILQSHEIIAESSDYHMLTITVILTGLRGILTNYVPDVTIDTDGTLVETTDWSGRWRTLTARAKLSEDAMTATVAVIDGRDPTECTISLDSACDEIMLTARPPSLWSTMTN